MEKEPFDYEPMLTKREAWIGLCLGAIFIAAMALVLWLFASLRPVHAHDHEHPELNAWYQGLKSPAHGLCCDGTEATHLADPDWESRDGHYRVRLQGEWVDVPDDAVVTEPNRDGRALVWAFYGSNGWWIRCFMPGAGT